MRGKHKTARGHLLAPAIIMLAAVAVAVPGSLGRSKALDPAAELVANVSVRQEVSELRSLTRSGACGLASAFSSRDPLTGGFISVLFRLTDVLDQVTRDASGFVGWAEYLLTTEGLDGLDVLLDGVVALLNAPSGALVCPEEVPGSESPGDPDDDHAPCHT